MNQKNQAIDLITDFTNEVDITEKEKDIVEYISSVTGFVPQKNIFRGAYWGSTAIGSSHWLGSYEDIQVVLKIQGAKPQMSEADILKEFKEQNRSKIIRGPKVLKVIPWNDQRGYEALLLEYVKGEKALPSKTIQSSKVIRNFLKLYEEYKEKCIPKKPWFSKPKKMDITAQIEKLLAVSFKSYPKHPFRKPEHLQIVKEGAFILKKVYKDEDLEFVHSHFSANDLIYTEDRKNIVLFSNLFWKWRFPFYDAVFGYHWFMYELSDVPGITPSEIENQRSIWFSELEKLSFFKNGDRNKRLLDAALLERAMSGIIIDSFLMDSSKEISRYLYDSTISEVLRLTKDLK